MPKMKTVSGAKKRFKVTATGKVKMRHSFKRHILTKKTTKQKRNLGNPFYVNDADMGNVKLMLAIGK